MKRIDALLTYVARVGGSDLHLTAGLVPRVRVRGFLTDFPGLAPVGAEVLLEVLRETLDERQWAAFERDRDVDLAYALPGVGRFRVNAFQQMRGPAAVFRRIPEDIQTLEELQMPPAIAQLAKLRSGLVLLTGPTGAGKSTTLAAIIDRINETSDRHIVTVEDPIEFMHRSRTSLITQREVGRDTPTFATGVQAAIRESADVILVGELRDRETIALALLAAEMGSLVFATLHTNSAPKSIDRLVDAFSADEQPHVRLTLSEALSAVVAQILLPGSDGQSRVCAMEILLKTSALPNMIRDRNIPLLISHMQASRSIGMQTMDDSLEALWRNNRIAFDDALRAATDRPRFERMRPPA